MTSQMRSRRNSQSLRTGIHVDFLDLPDSEQLKAGRGHPGF